MTTKTKADAQTADIAALSDAEQCRAIVRVARDKRDSGDLQMTDIDLYDDARVRQEQGGCWVQAWVWVENVYIEAEG